MSERKQILQAISKANTSNEVSVSSQRTKAVATANYDLQHFKTQLQKYGCLLIDLASLDELPTKLAATFDELKLEKNIVIVDELADLAWQQAEFSTSNRWEEKHHSSVTVAEAAIAETGQFVVTSATDEQKLSLLADNHCIIFEQNKLYSSLDDLAEILGLQPNGVATLIAGASRTGDIEQTLILGAHGPRTLIVCLYTNS